MKGDKRKQEAQDLTSSQFTGQGNVALQSWIGVERQGDSLLGAVGGPLPQEQGSGQASGHHPVAGLKWDPQCPENGPAKLLMAGEVQSGGAWQGLRMELRGRQRVGPSEPQLLLGIQRGGLEVVGGWDWRELD